MRLHRRVPGPAIQPQTPGMRDAPALRSSCSLRKAIARSAPPAFRGISRRQPVPRYLLPRTAPRLPALRVNRNRTSRNSTPPERRAESPRQRWGARARQPHLVVVHYRRLRPATKCGDIRKTPGRRRIGPSPIRHHVHSGVRSPARAPMRALSSRRAGQRTTSRLDRWVNPVIFAMPCARRPKRVRTTWYPHRSYDRRNRARTDQSFEVRAHDRAHEQHRVGTSEYETPQDPVGKSQDGSQQRIAVRHEADVLGDDKPLAEAKRGQRGDAVRRVVDVMNMHDVACADGTNQVREGCRAPDRKRQPGSAFRDIARGLGCTATLSHVGGASVSLANHASLPPPLAESMRDLTRHEFDATAVRGKVVRDEQHRRARVHYGEVSTWAPARNDQW